MTMWRVSVKLRGSGTIHPKPSTPLQNTCSFRILLNKSGRVYCHSSSPGGPLEEWHLTFSDKSSPSRVLSHISPIEDLRFKPCVRISLSAKPRMCFPGVLTSSFKPEPVCNWLPPGRLLRKTEDTRVPVSQRMRYQVVSQLHSRGFYHSSEMHITI